MAYVNGDLPAHMITPSVPREALGGELAPGVTIDQAVAALVDGGIEADRVHVLHGDDGIAFLEGTGTPIGRLFSSDQRDQPTELLREGRTLVAIFDVPERDQDAVAHVAAEAGIKISRRYGRWTYS